MPAVRGHPCPRVSFDFTQGRSKLPWVSIEMFTHALVSPPAPNFAKGLTTVTHLGAPDYERALEQHDAYCAALEQCGLALTRLPADHDHPDSTFVEDTAVIVNDCAVLSRPGAASRLGEVTRMRETLRSFFPTLYEIQPPGTLDGGDVCEAGRNLFIGISERTNEAGAAQLTQIVARVGYTASLVDIRNTRALLHLKSGISYLGDNRLVIIEALANRSEFAGYELVEADARDEYAANCVRVNHHVLLACGYPRLAQQLRELGQQIIEIEMSEFQKMDGGLSCLSLRF